MASERGIICNGEEVRGILDGTITQLRRVVWAVSRSTDSRWAHGRPHWLNPKPVITMPGCWSEGGDGESDVVRCPFGVPGDRLFVRETWLMHDPFPTISPPSGGKFKVGLPLGKRVMIEPNLREYWRKRVIYRADNSDLLSLKGAFDEVWRSPTTMPRWASRIDLVNTAVRVERGKDGWEWVLGIKRLDKEGTC